MKNFLFAITAFAAALVSCNKETEIVSAPDSFTDEARIALTLTNDIPGTRAFFDSSANAEA